MADEEERIKAEKLAAAKKRVAQLQKQKKKASKKASTAPDAAKEIENTKESESTPDASPETTTEAAPSEANPAEEKPQEETPADIATTEQPAEDASKQVSNEEQESDESHTEPMPPAPTSPEAETESPPARLETDTPRAGHARQPSLSIQSKLRSSSFRKTSISQGGPSPPALKSPPHPLPPLTGNGESVHEVFRKQSTKIEELEADRKRLEKELSDATARWRKTEDQLEDLREASVDGAELREKLRQAEEKVASIDALKEEVASLQRQNSQLQSRSHRSNASVSVPPPSQSPPADLVRQLESKSATIESMELEISNLRAQVTSFTSSNDSHETQVAALESKLAKAEEALEKSHHDLDDTKQALNRASEKAVKEGVDKTSTETLIKSLEREVEELKNEKAENEKKIEALDKKLLALGNLHKESETRHQTRLRESEKAEKETAILRKKLATVESENLRLHEELDRMRKRDAGGTDDDALDELEDEERQRLERRIRELEGENFDLRRGVWQERRAELVGQQHADDELSGTGDPGANAFDDVDLVGGRPDHSRRRSMALQQRQQQQQQQHSSFTDVISSGLAAFAGGNRARSGSSNPPRPHGPATRGSLELLSEENLEDEFDEAEFARAQAEEEARKRVEWVREVKRKLRDWQGWRLDLVDSRAGAEGPGLALGQIFEV
ncbi:Uncharacterized protein PECH_008172 [Penicillium ucsense]|uniref:M protein repeat protein n=1 Tax=Penicillium ucsense TaxID=2839758 RepID=A0A8J8WFZ3_9EURO|nr:Uncharacterized protein PECM_000601 [Penicillium ucsense]KAF7734376.1 Uncharacterized protein PECH_008172 [Penicillium ucsense]